MNNQDLPVSALPPSLLERLALDNCASTLALRGSSPSEAIPIVKVEADRKLLAMTSRALDTIEYALDNGMMKDRTTAAFGVLDRSPATKPKDSLTAAGITLPPDAVAALITGLGSLFNQMGPAAAPPKAVNIPHESSLRNATPVKGEPL